LLHLDHQKLSSRVFFLQLGWAAVDSPTSLPSPTELPASLRRAAAPSCFLLFDTSIRKDAGRG
jgi:hypothetical protein